MEEDIKRRTLELMLGVRGGRLTRRQVLARGLALGLSSPVIMALLAACGSDDTDGDEGSSAGAEASPAATRVPVVVATNPPSSETSEPTVASGAAPSNTSENREFTILFAGGVPDLDPQSAYDSLSSSLFLGTYEMLIRLRGESTFEYQPMLATAWEVNDDQTEFTFTIAEGATFHDGTGCDAQAVVASFTRFLEMGLGPVNVISRFIDDASQMEAVDAATVRFTTSKPEPLFLAAMASEYGPLVVSPAAMEEHKTDSDPYAHEWFAQNMVGTGPYQATETLSQERFVLDRFEEYHGEPPFFDRIVARVVPEDATRRQLIESGEAHGVTNLPPEDIIAMRSNPALQVIEYDSTACNWINLNYAKLNRDVREGLCWAFPYDEVNNGVLRGFSKIQGPIADTVIGFDPEFELYTTDLERAAELLTQGGLTANDELEYILGWGGHAEVSIGELLNANLTQIGFNLKLTTVDRSTLVDLAYGDAPAEERPHLMSNGWWPDYNDSWNQLYPNFHSDSVGSAGANVMWYQNDETDALMDELELAQTEDEIKDLTTQVLQVLLWDDPAAIFYNQEIAHTVLGADIRGFKANGIYLGSYNFTDMWREAT